MDNIKNDKYYINQILDDIDKIMKYTNNVSYDDFMDDEQLIDAVLFRLIQMTETILFLILLKMISKKKKNIINFIIAL